MKIFNRLITSLLAVCMLVGAQSFVVSADRMPATPGKGEYLVTVKISEITVTGVKAPVDGEKPVETCQLGGTGYTLKSMSWYDGSLKMNSISTFQGGKTYRACFYFLPDDGYTFADAGDMTATVNGEPVEVVSVYGESEQRAVTINFTCPEPAKTTVSSVAMTFPVPAAGDAVVLPTIETPGVTFDDFYWLDEDWNEYKVGDKFVAGKTYHCQAYLTAEDGYEIPSAEDIPVTFNGAPAEYYSCPVTSPKNYAIADSPEYKVAAASSAVNTIKKIDVIVDEPVASAAPKMDVAKTTTEGISIYYVKWFDTDTQKKVSDKFEAGKGYTAYVYFELNKDYIMPKNLDEVSATINGKVATVTEASETDDMWIAAYDFPKLKDAVDSGTGSGSDSGTGDMYDYNSYSASAPWKNFSSEIAIINIGEGVTSIGTYAFYYCQGLTSATIPGSVISIGDSAFNRCSSLTSVIIQNGVTSIGDDAFNDCTGLTSVTIPGSVTSIGDHAFDSCSSLTSITIPDGVKSIGAFAFYWCGKLESITLPDSVTSIGDQAFYKTACYNDDSEWDVLYIGNHLIKADTNISGAYSINPGTKTIGDCAFYYCKGLKSITIPDSAVSIGNQAFYSCSGLNSIIIPKSVTSIGDYAFQVCVNLTEISVDTDNTAYCSENGILYNKEKTEIICFPNKKQDTLFTIPNSVTSIAYGAFSDCRNLTSITIPNSVTSIGNDAFNTCSGLTSVTIPDSVTSLGNKAFFGCSSLTSVTIPNSVTSIGEYAFSDCNNLNEVNYIGSEADWAAITKGQNYSIAENIIKYCKGINVVPSDDGRRIVVRPINIESGKTVTLALYDGNKFIEMQSMIYGGTEIPFTTDKAYTCAKVMVWNSLNEMSPECGVKIVE